MINLYGIKNCDTVKKAKKWLKDNQVDVEFHDFKSEGVTEKQLKAWSKAVGWETLLNRRGTTWRKLPESEKENLSEAKAIQIMAQHPSCIKRPVVEKGTEVMVGFSQETYEPLKTS